MTKDPEIKFAKGNGTAITKFSIAVNRTYKKEGQPEADFINCLSFGKTAELIANHFVKGKQIALTGSIQTGSYDNKEGHKVYTTDILVDSFEFIGSKNDGSDHREKTPKESEELEPVNDEDIPF